MSEKYIVDTNNVFPQDGGRSSVKQREISLGVYSSTITYLSVRPKNKYFIIFCSVPVFMRNCETDSKVLQYQQERTHLYQEQLSAKNQNKHQYHERDRCCCSYRPLVAFLSLFMKVGQSKRTDNKTNVHLSSRLTLLKGMKQEQN